MSLLLIQVCSVVCLLLYFVCSLVVFYSCCLFSDFLISFCLFALLHFFLLFCYAQCVLAFWHFGIFASLCVHLHCYFFSFLLICILLILCNLSSCFFAFLLFTGKQIFIAIAMAMLSQYYDSTYEFVKAGHYANMAFSCSKYVSEKCFVVLLFIYVLLSCVLFVVSEVFHVSMPSCLRFASCSI